MLHLLLFSILVLQASGAAQTPEVIEARMEAGGAWRVERRAEIAGTLHAWVEAEGFSVRLRITPSGGEARVDVAGPGAQATPFVAVPVEVGAALSVEVEPIEGAGAIRVHILATPESASSRQLAGQADQRLRAMAPDAPKAESRAALAKLVDELCTAPESKTSCLMATQLARAARRANSLDDFATAARAWGSARPVLDRSLPDDHVGRLGALYGMARTLFEQGQLEESAKLDRAHLVILARTLAGDDPFLNDAKLSLASTLFLLGELDEARALQEAALAAYTGKVPPQHPALLACRGNLALSCKALGDIDRALSLEREIVAALEGAPDADPVDLARGRHNLATTCLGLDQLEEARALEQKVDDALAKVLDPADLDLTRPRAVLGQILRRQNRLGEARALQESVLAAREAKLPESHPDVLRARAELAQTLLDQGEVPRGVAMLARCVELQEEKPFVDPIAAALLYQELSTALLESGDVAGARLRAGQALAIARESAERAALSAAPREAEARASTFSKFSAWALTLSEPQGEVPADPKLLASAFETQETLRAAASTSARILSAIQGDERGLELRAQLRTQTRRVANPARAIDGDAELRAVEERDAAWRALVQHASANAAAGPLLAAPRPESLAAKLDADEALIAFWRSDPSVLGAMGPTPKRALQSRLLAFVLRSGRSLVCIDLGPPASVEAAAQAWRDALLELPARSEAEVLAAGKSLCALVFDPLRPALGDARRLRVVLDDMLHAVPFDALPGRAKFLGDEFQIEFPSTARELLWPPRPSVGEPSLVVVGNPDFGTSGASEQVPGSRAAFAPLPSSALEARGIAELFKQSFEGAAQVELLGADATRTRFEDELPRARWLHVATHGWSDAALGKAPRIGTEIEQNLRSPLVLCGLALAGANRDSAEGRITAEELSSLDLGRCELAVLSACDTNAGVQRAGQGVASLQRAVQLAGARSALTSLWRVADEPARDLMLEFYRRLWVEHEPPSSALWNAKLSLRAHRQPQRAWAGWTLASGAR